MRVRCAWCGYIMVAGNPGAETTDGICPACDLGLAERAGTLLGIARRLLRARAKANAPDFERALAEMRRAVEEVGDGE